MGSQSGEQAKKGLNSNNPVDIIKHNLKPRLLQEEEILQLYVQEGLTLAQVALRTDLSRARVRTLLKDQGITPKDQYRPFRFTGQVPYGWRKENGRLVPHQSEQITLRKIREFRAQGVSLHEIARRLTQEGAKTKAGGKWHAKTVSQILAVNERLAKERV